MIKRLNVMFGDQRVGQLLADRGVHYFRYDVGFLQEGLELSPYKLPLRSDVSEHRSGFLHSLPGLMSDSLPDAFGMEVLKQYFVKKQKPDPSPLEMLSYLGDRTMGALTYEPVEGDREDQESIDLVRAALAARKIQEHRHYETLDPVLARAGGTAGGMTPKVLAALSKDRKTVLTGADTIPDGMEAWLIKMNTGGNNGPNSVDMRLEHAYFKMAAAAGINVPETILLEDDNGELHFAIRRFDRMHEDPNQRVHTHSYAGLMELDYKEASHDYEQLLRLTKDLTRDYPQLVEQFRRMLFNILAHIHDDHAKNFAFCMDASGEWRVSPAYDLVHSSNNLNGNWMTVQGKRSGISRNDLEALGELVGLKRRDFTETLEQVESAVMEWPEFAQESGLGENFMEVVQARIKKQLGTL